MTRYSDNIYSGFEGLVSADSSRSAVLMGKTHFVSAGSNVNVTVSGTFPPGTQNVTASVYVIQQGAATTNDNIILYANGNAATGQKLLSFLAIGSAATRLAPTSWVTSAAANPLPPATNQTNGGEVPYQLIVSSVSTASYQIHITFSRTDGNTLGTSQ